MHPDAWPNHPGLLKLSENYQKMRILSFKLVKTKLSNIILCFDEKKFLPIKILIVAVNMAFDGSTITTSHFKQPFRSLKVQI